eukprot:6336255-Prymnesium_polylepis.3
MRASRGPWSHSRRRPVDVSSVVSHRLSDTIRLPLVANTNTAKSACRCQETRGRTRRAPLVLPPTPTRPTPPPTGIGVGRKPLCVGAAPE